MMMIMMMIIIIITTTTATIITTTTIMMIMMVMMMTMMMMMMMMMIAFKGAVGDFLQSLHCAANQQILLLLKWPRRNRVQITCNTPSAYHVQRVVCHLVRRDSSAFKFDRIEFAFILPLFYWLNLLTDELYMQR